jgi:ANTAR domain
VSTVTDSAVGTPLGDGGSATSRMARAFLLAARSDAVQQRLDRAMRQVTRLLPGAESAELLVCRPVVASVAASDDDARALAALRRATVEPGDVAEALLESAGRVTVADRPAWAAWQRRAHRLGSHSFASIPLAPNEVKDTAVVLHSGGPDPLIGAEPGLVQLVADLVASTIRSLALADQVRQLNGTARTNLRLGVAVGVLVDRYQISDEDALLMLQRTSRRRRCELNAVVEDVLTACDP